MNRPNLSGTTIGGHFCLKNRLGSGHFGDVYLCENMMLAHTSALKVIEINPATSNTPVLEAQLLNISKHAHIVKVRSAAEWQNEIGQDYLLIEMEYVPGGSLEDAIKNEISIGKILSIMKNVLFALDHAHPNVIHRDVKPANILLGDGGQLSDFGIAMVASTGESVSNLQYVLNRAPECFPPTSTFGISTDVYAAGLTLMRSLNLFVDWQNVLLSRFGSAEAVIERMKAGTLVAGLGFHPRVPLSLQKIVKKACAKDTAKRYSSASAFRDALEAIRVDRNWKRATPNSWECIFEGLPEMLKITNSHSGFEVNYTRNGRRKTPFCKGRLTQVEAFTYAYELIAQTTFD